MSINKSAGETPGSKRESFDMIAYTIRSTGGLTLSQLASISGLETTTIQNWVKRGWVESPDGRLYGEHSTARVLIIAMLRSVMQLSDIVYLMSYINGKVDDRSDDAIDDGQLYQILCSITSKLDSERVIDEGMIDSLISRELASYTEPFEGGLEKLRNTLRIMSLAYLSARLKDMVQALLETTVNK